MVILALETATRRGSMALCDGDVCVARDGDESRTHGERLPNELLDWLTAHGRRLDDVDAFAVVTGPGSFTGLHIFLAAFDASGAATIEDCRVLIEPRVGRPEESAAALAALAPPAAMTLVGNGAQKYAEVFLGVLPDVHIAGVPQPIAEAAARIATRRVGSALSPHALRPVYLRRPDAELARERAGARPERGGAEVEVGWRIAVAEPADLAAVEALQRRAFTNPWGADAIKWELENTDVARLYVMRGPAGSVVAYCACWKVFDELHINSLAVEESLRRRGLARRLLHFVILDAHASGARSATLEVRQSNHAARLLYEGLGFRVEGVRRDYYQDPREDALILWHRDLAKFAT
jgi:ribosomal-protein-alanine N-acetyltransferase